MVDVRVVFHANDRKVSAMVKALAFEVDGPKAVEGASKDFLKSHGHLIFHFQTDAKANEFREALGLYLPGFLARVSNEAA
jgi:hypothetical protein